MKEQKKRVSDIISVEDIDSWNVGDIITITAGTGRGKSYFIKHDLYDYAKKRGQKILFLLHRRNCKFQFKQEIQADEKTDIIDIHTYQTIENIKAFDISKYDYIVSDEFHYFFSDADFNRTTDISLDAILAQTGKTIIFMSATPEIMMRYLNNVKKIPTIDYKLPIDFDYIQELNFFNKYETLEKFATECIERNEKAIFFIYSAKKAYKLYKKFKENSLYNCSESNDHFKYVDVNKINNMLKNEKFEENILITTMALDAGVNIIDPEVKHIVVDVVDTDSLIQCLGRKRFESEEEKIYVYIKNINNQQLGGYITQHREDIRMAEYLENNTVQGYIKKYGRKLDHSGIVYDEVVEEENKGTKKINELARLKTKIDIAEMGFMIEHGYKEYVRKFVFDIDHYFILDEVYEKETLEGYLEGIVGKRLYDKEQKELSKVIIDELISISMKIDYRTKKLKPSTLENILRVQLELPYAVSKPKQEDIKVNGKRIRKNYIIISKIE